MTHDTSADTSTDTDACGTPDRDGDCVPAAEDCDDHDADVYPGAPEVCDGKDNDCDDEVDETGGATYYMDEDGDGYGDENGAVTACDRPDGTVDNGADCDDTNPDVSPATAEVRNGRDDDCDGDIDEDLPVDPTVTVTWDSKGATITISGGSGGYGFGMSETGAGDLGWFGETCIPGDEPWGYPDYGFDVCHSLGAAGGRLAAVGSPDLVVDGDTLFNQPIDRAGSITYSLFADDGSGCWVWGDDVSYYADFGCTAL